MTEKNNNTVSSEFKGTLFRSLSPLCSYVLPLFGRRHKNINMVNCFAVGSFVHSDISLQKTEAITLIHLLL